MSLPKPPNHDSILAILPARSITKDNEVYLVDSYIVKH